MDMFETFATWREPEGILEHATLAVALRPGSRRPRASRWERVGRGVVFLDNPGLEIASSALRDRVGAGTSVRYLVPDAVERYLVQHRLYRSRS